MVRQLDAGALLQICSTETVYYEYSILICMNSQYCYFTEWITSCLFDHFEMLNEINICLIGYFELSAHFPREGNINAKFVIAYGDLYYNPCCYKPVQFKPSIMNLQYCRYCYTMVTWKVFTQHTTMHGIKNIHMEKIHLARR